MKTNWFTELVDSIDSNLMQFLNSRWYWPVMGLWAAFVVMMFLVWLYK